MIDHPNGRSTSELADLHPQTRRLLSRRRFLGHAGTGAAVTFLGAFVVACSDDGGDATASSSTSTPVQGSSTTVASAPLYERLGGNPAIAAVVGAFLTNVAADPRINGFFANTDIPRLQALLVEQIGEATGGPERYTGRDMQTVHAGLGITEADFNALVEDLVAALDQYDVPQAEQDELLGILSPMEPLIVTV